MLDFSSLTYLDYVVLLTIAISTLLGFIRGFIGSFLSLFGWIASICLTYTFFPSIKPIIDEKITNQIIVIMVGHATLLIGFLILFGIFNLLATSVLTGMTSGIIDRALGAAFGVIRASIILSFVFLTSTVATAIFNGSDETEKAELPKWLIQSQTYPLLKDGSKILASFIPDSFYQRFENMYSEITNKTSDERFVDDSIEKLKKVLNSQKIRDIEADLAQTHDKNKKLQHLIDAHNEEDKKMDNIFSDAELERMKKILSKNNDGGN